MKIITQCSDVEYAFEKYCKLILSVIPKEHLLGIKEIKFIDKFSDRRTPAEALGCYLRGKNGKDAVIEIHIPNQMKSELNEHTFKRYPEIAAMLLSKTIFHEIGHHVHYYKRHGVTKREYESFADKYTKAGFYHYLKLRDKEILSEYRLGSFNFLDNDKEGRQSARQSRKDILAWMDEFKKGVAFP